MEEALTLEPDAENTAELKAAIDRCFAEMDRLRERMRRDQTSIESSRTRTRAMLADIADVLTELKGT